VPAERTASLIRMLLGIPVSPGFVDGASERLNARLEDAGFDVAMQAALEKEPVLAADETPVNLLDPHARLAEDEAGAPHLLVVRTPHRGLTWLRALGSRQHAAITLSPRLRDICHDDLDTLCDPGGISVMPVPITMEHAEPGGVSCTNRRASLTRWSWSA
jgi:Transposase IS66 family